MSRLMVCVLFLLISHQLSTLLHQRQSQQEVTLLVLLLLNMLELVGNVLKMEYTVQVMMVSVPVLLNNAVHFISQIAFTVQTETRKQLSHSSAQVEPSCM